MSEVDPNKVAGGDDDPGAGGPDPKDKKDTVAYETHKKLLDEKKAIQARLVEFESKAKAEKDAELVKNQKFEELLKEREKELAEKDAKLQAVERENTDARKLNAFMKNVPGEVPQQYWGLIDLDMVSVDDTGKVDDASVKRAVASFQKNYPEIVKKPNGKMPNEAPGGGAGTLTHEQWEKLPYAEKKTRMKDVKLD